MRIERIELENWMSYPRRWITWNEKGDDQQEIPTIDLSTQPLILIAGDNGAGKSAILEAVCYALFAKYPRGNIQDAIRSGETTAKVGVRFSLPSVGGDVAYHVERLLTSRSGGNNATLKQVRKDGQEIILLTGQSAVTEHIEKTLLRGIDYDAFVSTVFLRQEEAGKFMGLSHGNQREQLLRLCRLEVYKEIYASARQHRVELEKQIVDLEDRFGQVEYATSEHLSDRCEHAEELRHRCDELRIQAERAKQLLRDIRRAATLKREIDERREKLAEWSQILDDADQIRHANRWTTAWDRVRSTLLRGRQIHESLLDRVDEIEQVRSDLEKAKQKMAQLAKEHDTLAADHWHVRQILDQVRDDLLVVLQEKEHASRALDSTRAASRLDDETLKIRQEQNARESRLGGLDEVRRKLGYTRLLTSAQNTLQYALEKLENAESEEQAAQVKNIEAQEAKQAALRLEGSVAQKKATLQELETKGRNLQHAYEEANRLLERSRDIVRSRHQAIEAGICPTCGIEISGEIGEHVHEEVEWHEAETTRLENEIENIHEEVSANRSDALELAERIKAREQEATSLRHRAQLAGQAGSSAMDRAARDRQQAEQRWQQHLATWEDMPYPDWLATPSVDAQTAVSRELTELVGVEDEYDTLTEISFKFQSEAEKLRDKEQERAKIPVVSPVSEKQLEDLRTALEDCLDEQNTGEAKRDELVEKLDGLADALAGSQEKLDKAKDQLATIERELSTLSTSQENDRQHLRNIEVALHSEQQQLDQHFPDLARDLLRAIGDRKVCEQLEELADGYRLQADQVDELHEAENRTTSVETEINLKREELGDLSEEISRVSEKEASRRLEALESGVNSIERELTDVLREIGNIERDHEDRQGLEGQLQQAKQDCWAYRVIEDAIYPGTMTKPAGELFAYITRKLMENISSEASRILDSLKWHMAIGYDEKDGFSIKDEALSAIRKYSEFSGGERFAIAVAVALAIGRVTHGAGNIRCLFIDEGFGALDSKHRKRIITDAIGKLIEIGSRDQVVVITHLKDMYTYFPDRIELKRETDHSALVPPDEEMLE